MKKKAQIFSCTNWHCLGPRPWKQRQVDKWQQRKSAFSSWYYLSYNWKGRRKTWKTQFIQRTMRMVHVWLHLFGLMNACHSGNCSITLTLSSEKQSGILKVNEICKTVQEWWYNVKACRHLAVTRANANCRLRKKHQGKFDRNSNIFLK